MNAPQPRALFAPGRVNLLGEHTDTTGGLVLPLAIDRGTRVRASQRRDGAISVRSTSRAEPLHISACDELVPRPAAWSNYVLGVVAAFAELQGERRGLELEIEGDVPEGAGLASSASLTVAVARALNELFGAGLEPLALARLCQRVEHEWCGVRCGLMDQAAAALLAPGEALFLDCHSLAWHKVKMPVAAVAIVASGVQHRLAAQTGYGERLAETRRILELLPEYDHLGALSEAQWAAVQSRLPPALAPRLAHIVSENARVRGGLADLARGDLAAFGARMLASHASLRDCYQVSCPELDRWVARLAPLAYGAKMTGAGFGGAVVAILAPHNLPALREATGDALVHACTVGVT